MKRVIGKFLARAPRIAIFMAILGFSAAGVVPAQVFPDPVDTTAPAVANFGVGPQLGYFKSVGADEGSFHFGVAARYMIGSMLGFEGTLGYRGGQTFDFGRVSGNDLSAKITSVPLTASVMLFVPLRTTSFVPYLLAGGGLYLLTIDYSAAINAVMGDQTKTKAGTHLGLGANFALTPRIAAHADYRYLFLSNIFEGGQVFDFSGKNYNGNALTLGFSVFF